MKIESNFKVIRIYHFHLIWYYFSICFTQRKVSLRDKLCLQIAFKKKKKKKKKWSRASTRFHRINASKIRFILLYSIKRMLKFFSQKNVNNVYFRHMETLKTEENISTDVYNLISCLNHKKMTNFRPSKC